MAPAVVQEAIQNPDKSHVGEIPTFVEQAGQEYETKLSSKVPEPTPDNLKTGETVRPPSSIFYVTDMYRE